MTNSQKIIKYFAIAFAIFLIYTISSAIITSAGIIIKSFDKKPNDEVLELKEIYTSDKINSLDIDLNATNLIIKTDEKVSIQTNNSYIKVKEKLGVLKIEEYDNISSKPKDLIVYIPSSILDEIDIETGAGTIYADELNAKRLDLSLGAGTVTLLKVDSDIAKIDGGTGKFEIRDGRINNLDFDAGIGEVYIKSKLEGSNKIDTGVGKVTLDLIGRDYKLSVEKGIGTILIDNKKAVNNETFGNGKNHVLISGGVGEIEVNYVTE